MQRTRTAPCVAVHGVLLGDSDPFGNGLYSPFVEPLATTPLATERLILSACVKRAELDAVGTPVVFTSLDLKSDVAGGPIRERAKLVADLYQCFLAATRPRTKSAIALELDRTRSGFGKRVRQASRASRSVRAPSFCSTDPEMPS